MFGESELLGVNNQQTFCTSRANTSGIDFHPYKVVRYNDFVYNPARLDIGSIAKFDGDSCIVSTLYEVFRIQKNKQEELCPEFLQMLFARPEFARYVGFKNWGSAREYFWLDSMKRTPIPVPSIDVQRKVVETWQGLRRMKEENEKLAEPLMQLCRSYLQECKKKYPMVELGPMISSCDERNANRNYGVDAVRGVNITKDFMPTAANIESVDLRKYKVVSGGRFVFSGMQTGRDGCIRIALSTGDDAFLVSPAYDTFEVSSDKLLPEYLHLLFLRPEMDRLGWFLSDSSVRANLDWNRFCEIKIPLPPIEVQQAVVDVYRCANEAKKIAEEADRLSREICPALVRWAADTEANPSKPKSEGLTPITKKRIM